MVMSLYVFRRYQTESRETKEILLTYDNWMLGCLLCPRPVKSQSRPVASTAGPDSLEQQIMKLIFLGVIPPPIHKEASGPPSDPYER